MRAPEAPLTKAHPSGIINCYFKMTCFCLHLHSARTKNLIFYIMSKSTQLQWLSAWLKPSCV